MRELKNEDIYTISSQNNGPRVTILGGVHGNEIGGVEAIKEILEENSIDLTNGEVNFIYANRKAIDNNVRFMEDNLNRCFLDNNEENSYEKRLAEDIKEYLENSDFCLDLHASFSKKSEPFIICEENGFRYVENLPVNTICGGFDTVEPGGTDYYMNQIGGTGICVECGYLGDPNTKEVAKESVKNFLSGLGMLNLDFSNSYKKNYLRVEFIYKARENFKLSREFKDFEFLEEGDLIGYDGDEIVKAKYKGFILFAKDVEKDDKDRECFLYGRKLNIF